MCIKRGLDSYLPLSDIRVEHKLEVDSQKYDGSGNNAFIVKGMETINTQFEAPAEHLNCWYYNNGMSDATINYSKPFTYNGITVYRGIDSVKINWHLAHAFVRWCYGMKPEITRDGAIRNIKYYNE